MVNWFSEITFTCQRDLKVMMSEILAAILNLDNLYYVKIVPAINSAPIDY